MDTSLGALRARLFNYRAWDSTGTTLDNRIREAMNTALDRISGDVPEAVVPDDEHIVLLPDAEGTDASVNARMATTSDTRVLEFTDPTGAPLTASSPWVPATDGSLDGLMHFEIVDPKGQRHRYQSREFWIQKPGNGPDRYYVSIDRPWDLGTATLMKFRMLQPEFFVRDDVTRVLEPARIYDETRQQVWAIDTGGAYRQDLIDFLGDDKGRPFRFWRGRHFQLPAPTTVPTVAAGTQGVNPWAGPEWEGSFRFCYTYVWGRKEREWQFAPGGIRDPQWESAPSPVSAAFTQTGATAGRNIQITGTNIDAMMDFGESSTLRYSRSGMRLRIYVAREGVATTTPYGTGFNRVETNGKFYLLAEIEPVAGTFTWTGAAIPDYERELKHSTGYYAYSAFPHQDQRYELDFRVQRLPQALKNDQDTVPIQRDAVMAYIELSLYYMCLMDGVDQSGAQIHLGRYNDLARHFRKRYANPGGVVEPTPITGYQVRFRYGRYRDMT
jgi:hypothetical protein